MADALPPSIGMLVRGRYLWHEKAAAGVEHAPYSRPCLVMGVFKRDDRTMVDVLPLSTKPQKEDSGFEVPPEIAQRLKLPRDASYVVTAEKNTVEWTPRFTENIPGRDTPVYGHLTPGLTRKAGNERLAHEKNGEGTAVDRDQTDGAGRSVEQMKAIQQQVNARGLSAKPREGPEHEP